jgi:molecular chaperone DnaK (HSP70)
MTSYGIDFGTTNSVLAGASARAEVETVVLDDPPADWAELGFDRVLPTVMAEIGGAIVFGWAARRTERRLEAVKRLFASHDDMVEIGDRELRIEEAAAMFFRHVRDRALAEGRSFDQAVVTIPANSRGKARFRTKVSAGLAGLEVLALLNEPTAAAIAHGRHIRDGQRVLVFDWGGGTLDVTVLQRVHGVFVEEASKGIPRLGGLDLDAAFRQAVLPRVPAGAEIDHADLERAKILLSTREATTLALRGGGTLEVTRAEFEDAVRELVVRTREPIERCMADLGAPRIDHLVLVGGSSKIPAVRRFVREMLRLEPMEGVDPMTAVAEGAAIAAGILREEIADFDFFVGTEHALGTVVHDLDDRPQFSTLIPRNTKLPASATSNYTPAYDNQTRIKIRVVEGDPDQPFDHEDNVILKEWEVPIQPRTRDQSGFAMTYLYDVDGILHVTARDLLSDAVLLDEHISFGAGTSKHELAEIRRRVDAARAGGGGEEAPPPPGTPGLSEESRAVVRRAKEKIHPFVDDATQAEIDRQIAALVAAGPDGEAAARAALEATIRAHSYLL